MRIAKRIKHITIVLLALLTSSCEQDYDNYRYPSVVTDYACLLTNSVGKIEHMHLDNGRTYPVNFTDEFLDTYNSQEPIYKADTLYRAISVYELGTNGNETIANIYSLGSIVSSVPTTLPVGKKLYQDPVYLQSIWLSGGYLNFILEVKALNGKHSIGYIDTTPKGMNGKEFTFYHQVVNDVESYRQKLYGSIPLSPFEELLQPKDTLRFVINLYDKGITEHLFIL